MTNSLKHEDKNSELLTIRFGCTAHEVNAEAVASMIRAVAHLIHASKNEISSNGELSVKVRAFAPGSLEIPLELVIPTGVLILEKSPILASVLSILKDYLSWKKWFKGRALPDKHKEKPYDKDDKKFAAVAETANIGTINIYTNSQVNNYFAEAFHETRKDSSVKDVAFYTGNKKELLVVIPETYFPHFDVPTHEIVSLVGKEQSERVIVTIATPVLQGKGKWRVIYNKRVIGTSIGDEDFLQKVASTYYRFGTGDKLDVDMNIKFKLDKATDEILVDPRGYVITKVWRHIPKQAKRKSTTTAKNESQQKTFFDSG